ncbi:MAG: aminoacyl-tRNA hydrolase [Acidimicrobiales bacterium]|nr:aminoacyl-tRNA hydrolase [Acidimicrobiales bacterium]
MVSPGPEEEGRAFLRITPSCRIPLSELTFRYSPPGGPGGQHANVTRSRVEVTFDARRSPSLEPHQRDRIVERLGPVVGAVASDHRSQARNRALALERLSFRLAVALRPRPARRKTAPSPAARERRLAAKRRRSELKRSRGAGNLE